MASPVRPPNCWPAQIDGRRTGLGAGGRARNIYNLSFFYGQFITHLVEHKKVDQVKKSFGYLRFYGVEIAKAFPKVPSVYFDVAVIAFEMKRAGQ